LAIPYSKVLWRDQTDTGWGILNPPGEFKSGNSI
jgi:hypothetical protein